MSFDEGKYVAEQIPSALFYAFIGRGHLPNFSATEEFCRVLANFIRYGTVPSVD